MINATLYTPNKYFLNNALFDLSKQYNTNTYMFYVLRNRFKDYNINISTQDLNPLESSAFIIYEDMPIKMKSIIANKINYLIMAESKAVRPDNWILENHKYFKKIFTCYDELVDNKKYIKINYGQHIPDKLEFNIEEKYKLCTMIAGNKIYKHPLELYTERIKAIRWFEEYHPEDFDLFGIGWDRYYFQGPFKKFNSEKLNKLNFLRRLISPKYTSYKGPVVSKTDVLKRYKFSICYENTRDVSGYITEKIFDCFFAGCVPIYWGAPNITNYIPNNTFIDKRYFKTYEELYRYIKFMSDKEYIAYLDSIKAYIKSDRIYPFSAEHFADTIIQGVIGNYD